MSYIKDEDLPRHAWDTPPFLLIVSPTLPVQSVDAYVRTYARSVSHVTTKRKEVDHIPWVWGSVPRAHRARWSPAIMWGCNGPKERISAFVDRLIQPITQKQDSYLKDTTDFLNFIDSTKLPKNTVLVSMDVTSLYTNIPRRERNTRMSRIQSPYTHQVPKRNSPPYINRNLVPFLR